MKDIGILQELQLALTSNRMSAKVPLSKVKEYLIYSDVSFHFVSILAKIVNKVGSSAQNPLNLDTDLSWQIMYPDPSCKIMYPDTENSLSQKYV